MCRKYLATFIIVAFTLFLSAKASYSEGEYGGIVNKSSGTTVYENKNCSRSYEGGKSEGSKESREKKYLEWNKESRVKLYQWFKENYKS